MSLSVMTLVSSRIVGSPTKKAVLLAMADAASEDGSGVWLSQARVALSIEVKEKTVQRTQKLLAEGEGALIELTGKRKVYRGYNNVWRIKLDVLESLPKVVDLLENPLGDKMTGGGSTGGLSVPDRGTLTPSLPPSVSYEPSIEPSKEPSISDISEELWNLAPMKAKTRSSRALVKKQLLAALKKIGGEKIVKAYSAYLSDPTVSKDDFAFAPGLHRWIKDEKWDGYMDATAQTSEDIDAKDLDRYFKRWVDSGGQVWDGAMAGWTFAPDHKLADYDEVLYARYGIKRAADHVPTNTPN